MIPPHRVVVNADDFGRTKEINLAIAACFAAGRLSSCTLMANQPFAEEAVALARQNGFANRIGVHLCLTLGPPLSAALAERLGGLEMRLPERRLLASPNLLQAVTDEFRAQIGRVVALGVAPTHLDSHEHIINGFPYGIAALRAARTFGIRRIRISRNLFYERRLGKTVFKLSYNAFLRAARMRTTDAFTDVKPYLDNWRKRGRLPAARTVELMTHPGVVHPEAEHGVTDETTMLLGPEFGRLLAHMRLISYAEV